MINKYCECLKHCNGRTWYAIRKQSTCLNLFLGDGESYTLHLISIFGDIANWG